MKFHVASCSTSAAKYAVEHWHYSRRMPKGKLVRFGVWENDQFVGAVIFGQGAVPCLGNQFGLGLRTVAELVRIALRKHETPVTRIVAVCLRMLRRMNPGIRAVLSFADPYYGHHGGIYQGGNWLYLGRTADSTSYWFDGRWVHSRTVSHLVRKTTAVRSDFKSRTFPGKHRYAYVFDESLRPVMEAHAKPFPKRSKPSGEASGIQPEEGGSTPTRPLQSLEGK